VAGKVFLGRDFRLWVRTGNGEFHRISDVCFHFVLDVGDFLLSGLLGIDELTNVDQQRIATAVPFSNFVRHAAYIPSERAVGVLQNNWPIGLATRPAHCLRLDKLWSFTTTNLFYSL